MQFVSSARLLKQQMLKCWSTPLSRVGSLDYCRAHTGVGCTCQKTSQRSLTPHICLFQHAKIKPLCCTWPGRSFSSLRYFRDDAHRIHGSNSFAQVYKYSTRRRSYFEEGETEEEVRVTVTCATLLNELTRLFPHSDAYKAWRLRCYVGGCENDLECSASKDMLTEQSAEVNSLDKAVSVSSHRTGAERAGCFLRTPRSRDKTQATPVGVHRAYTHELSEEGARVLNRAHPGRSATETYDWRCLFLVRCTMPPESTSPSSPSSSSLAFSEEMSDLTEEGRAVVLWQRLALSMNAASKEPSKKTLPAADVMCWTRPATYALFYCGEALRYLHSASVEGKKSNEGNVQTDSPRWRRGEMQGTPREHVCRVGELHAIPGLPQPAAVKLSTFAPRGVSTTELAAHVGSFGETDAATYEAARTATLCGSVCSLHDYYYTHLCGISTAGCQPKAKSRNPTRFLSESEKELLVKSNLPSDLSSSVTSSPVQFYGKKEQGTPSQAAPSVVKAASNDSSLAFPTSRFPFPVFHEANSTERSSAQRWIGKRWDAASTQNHSCTRAIAGDKVKQGTPMRGSAEKQCQTNTCGSQLDDAVFIPQPEGVHCISSMNLHARHWNCVPASAFLREFILFHQFSDLAAVNAPRTATTTPHNFKERNMSLRKGTTCKDTHNAPENGLCVALPSAAARTTIAVVRHYSVGVLLVHEHEWIYFSLLLHTPCVEPSCAAPSSRTAVKRIARSRSANLAHYYCFLHLPCRLSTPELLDRARDASRCGERLRPTTSNLALPRTWLVHVSSAAKLGNQVDCLWEMAGLREHTGEVGVVWDEQTNLYTPHVKPHDIKLPGSKSSTEGKRSIFDSPSAAPCGVVPPLHTDRNDDCSNDEGSTASSNSDDGDNWYGDSQHYLDESTEDARVIQSIRAAAYKKKAHQAREIELLCRYLENASRCRSETEVLTKPMNTAQNHALQLKQATLEEPPDAADERASSKIISKTLHVPHYGEQCQPERISVFPFPQCSYLLRNRAWYAKPYVLAEEMKYGTIVKYKRFTLAVPRTLSKS